MANWQRQSVLQDFREELQNACLQGPGLRIRELPFTGKLMIRARGYSEAVQLAVSQVIGHGLPLMPNTTTKSAKTVFWMGPAEWMILCDSDETLQILRKLESALTDTTFLVSDVSDARTGIEVSGVHARSLMSRVCSLDLDTRSFGPGRCAQSLLARVPLLLHQVDKQPSYQLYVDRSLAQYAWDWLTDAAREFISVGDPQ